MPEKKAIPPNLRNLMYLVKKMKVKENDFSL